MISRAGESTLAAAPREAKSHPHTNRAYYALIGTAVGASAVPPLEYQIVLHWRRYGAPRHRQSGRDWHALDITVRHHGTGASVFDD